MSSKRQQARNEKALQDLVHNVAGNNICADCHTRNPAWASWSLGVFLCMRCAAIHRKLGTHISKVKSLSMDSWTNEQVDNMRKVGNVVSNQIYNPENKKPPVPVDADEADSAMERFIRQKYTNNVAKKSSNPSSPRFDEGTPPPLPPKNSKFGFRSATSSLFPMSRSKKEKAAAEARGPPSPNLTNKPSKVFGTTVGYDNPDEAEKKLMRLRDMGFQDAQRNAMVLKGVNGDMEKAIEALVRLGEGDRRSPAASSPIDPPTLRTSKSMTPLSSSSAGISVGLTVSGRANSDRPFTPSSATTSNNPFDAFPTAQPQTAQSTGSLQNNNPYHTQSTNPFGPVRQSTDPLSQAFQGLTVAPQPLFPNHTGGPAAQQPPQQVIYQQTSVPSHPASPQHYQGLPFPAMPSMTYPQPSQQPVQQQPTGYNPFFSNNLVAPQQPQMPQMPQSYSQQNLSLHTGQVQLSGANNPFARSPTRIASPSMLGQIPEQSQSNFQSMSPVHQQSPQAAMSNNPFFTAAPTQSPAPMGQQQQYFAPQRPDTASIMALYGQPAANPAQSMMSPVQQQPQQQQQQPPASPNYATYAQQPNSPAAPEQAMQLQRAQTAPVAAATLAPMSPAQSTNSKNPFMNAATMASPTAPTDPFAAGRHVTRESIILGNDMAWANGRHSPDAFASLSARHV